MKNDTHWAFCFGYGSLSSYEIAIPRSASRSFQTSWRHTLAVFRACLPRRGRKYEDNRRFLGALHLFTVENVCWRALPQRFGHWNSVWKRFDRLSKADVFEAFFDALASMNSTAHRLQMFNSTVVRAHVSAAGAKGENKAKRSGARVAVSPRKSANIGRPRGYHRLRPDQRRNLRRASLRNLARYRARHSAPRRDLRQRLHTSKANRDAARARGIAPVIPTRPTKRTSYAKGPRPARVST